MARLKLGADLSSTILELYSYSAFVPLSGDGRGHRHPSRSEHPHDRQDVGQFQPLEEDFRP